MEKVPLFFHSTAKSIFEKRKKIQKSNVQSFCAMIKIFLQISTNLISADNFQDQKII